MTAPSPPEYELQQLDAPLRNTANFYPSQFYEQMPQPQPPISMVQVAPAMIITQVLPNVGRNSTTVICPMCNTTVSTKVIYTNGIFAHIMSFLCCLFILCCCIPYCCNGFKDAYHYCPNCNALIAKDARM